ncbi:CDP-alcohol phosphatidyltransferase family protein [Methylosinus sporium]|uniref:CDP-alcohol phosphatidyltransferase family protein n=1 Tax=Methylosinus sporium TaxID=428 RepID=UPI000D5904A9|nr:CDP-alcohol phosphatidyltransferase family protein [Methylosinus sporium]PWB88671.1 hypothetical protein C5688_19940 [Methylocystis sp. MitZ-2018]
MLRYLNDPANMITSCGVLFSALAIQLAIDGRLEIAVAVALWAMLADQLDGVVAKRTSHRAIETAQMGKALDGFADLLYGAVVPAIVVAKVGDHSPLSLLVVSAMLLAGAIRLSYFANFGLSGGYFRGVPLSYDIPLLAVLFLMRSFFGAENFSVIVPLCFAALTASHVASIRVPAPNKAMYFVIILFSVSVSGALALRTIA